MEAPKLRSMFRNVRTEPRRFAFRSRHQPDVPEEWIHRKRRVEADVLGQPLDGDSLNISFKRGRGESVLSDRAERRKLAIRGARRAAIRAAIIGVFLCWMAYQGILWLEGSEFANIMNSLQNE
jgi:hypothetical protein